MDNGRSWTGTMEVHPSIQSSSSGLDIHQPLLLRALNTPDASISSHGSEIYSGSARRSRIVWSAGTVINSAMGRRKVNCCGVYPDIALENYLASDLDFSSSSSSSSTSRTSTPVGYGENEDSPKVHLCSANCPGHPPVALQQSTGGQTSIPYTSAVHPTNMPDMDSTDVRFVVKPSNLISSEQTSVTNLEAHSYQ